jgi:secondary thiamine-phosphate synthase enzyme
MEFFRRLVPEGMDWIVHDSEGPDDMPAHIRTALTQTSIGIPIGGGRPMLGTWQGLYLFEHRARPHRRQVIFQIMGE